ncbi:hypothetical protein GJ496_001586 [Pomphorhynchus laevis]|nr:hypothetical protein GJ496_001586 [Pomphorhynchus laevis]
MTFKCSLPKFYTFDMPALFAQRGIPISGIVLAIKPPLDSWNCKRSDNVVSRNTPFIMFVSAYFNPTNSAADIIDEASQHLNFSHSYKPC